jgi:hypothetical protein
MMMMIIIHFVRIIARIPPPRTYYYFNIIDVNWVKKTIIVIVSIQYPFENDLDLGSIRTALYYNRSTTATV